MGLVCWRYTLEGRLPHLESNLGPDAFDLFMCEEDGTVDRDFPCLDWRETFSKYGFQQLALVPRKEEVIGQHRVTLHLPDGSFTELSVDRTLTLGELLEQGLQKRRRTLPSLGHSQVGRLALEIHKALVRSHCGITWRQQIAVGWRWIQRPTSLHTSARSFYRQQQEDVVWSSGHLRGRSTSISMRSICSSLSTFRLSPRFKLKWTFPLAFLERRLK